MSEDADNEKLRELSEKLEEATSRIADLSKENAKWRRQAQGKDLTPEMQERLDSIEAERDDLKAKLSEATKAAAKAAKDVEAANKRADDIDSSYTRALTDAALSEALTKAGVTQPVHIKAAKAMLAGQLQAVDENGARVVKAGDKALANFITEWAGSDEGKFFVTAHEATGGGSQSGSRPATPTVGNFGGTRAERAAAIGARFPDLPK